jgi:hypothetical protein
MNSKHWIERQLVLHYQARASKLENGWEERVDQLAIPRGQPWIGYCMAHRTFQDILSCRLLRSSTLPRTFSSIEAAETVRHGKRAVGRPVLRHGAPSTTQNYLDARHRSISASPNPHSLTKVSMIVISTGSDNNGWPPPGPLLTACN